MSAAALGALEAGAGEPRRAYSYEAAARDYCQSITTLRKAVKEGRVRTRHTGRSIRLHPGDLEREFGFAATSKPAGAFDPRARRIADKILQRLP